MPISTVYILKYVQQCYVEWFWTISSLGAPGSYHHFVLSLLSREISIPSILPPSFQRSKHSVSPSNRLTKDMPIHYNAGTVISWVHPTTSVWKLLQTNRNQIEYVAFWTRRVLNKVLYGEVPPWGLNPHRFIYHFSQKRYPFRIPFTSLTDSGLNLFIPFKYCKSTVFWIWVNRKTRPFYRLVPVIKGIC